MNDETYSLDILATMYYVDATGLDNSNLTANDVRNYSGVTPVPINQEWRLSLLPKMLSQRNKMESNFEDTKTLTIMIDSLCTS